MYMALDARDLAHTHHVGRACVVPGPERLAEAKVTLHRCPKNPACIVKNVYGNCKPGCSVCLRSDKSAA